jgi:large subunit ribosomal protein L10e
MGLRPGRCYSSTKDRPYTRHAIRVQKKDYIGAVPGLRTRQWNMGNGIKEFDTIIDLKVECGPHGLQIRDNAIESARMMINRKLVTEVGKDSFFLKLRVYPHQILRENKLAQGAGADRVSKGMSHSFGKAIGRAARIRSGQKIFSVLVNEADAEKAKKALVNAKSRFPCDIYAEIGKDVESIGTKPTKTRDMKKAEAESTKDDKEPAKEEAGKTGAKTDAKGDKKDAKKPDAKKEAPAKKK